MLTSNSDLANMICTVQATCRGSPYAAAIGTHGVHASTIRVEIFETHCLSDK